MSIALQCRMRIAYTAQQQRVMAPAAPQRAEARKKSPGTSKFSPAYTVEISDEARAKYEASRKGWVRRAERIPAQSQQWRPFYSRRTRIFPIGGWFRQAV